MRKTFKRIILTMAFIALLTIGILSMPVFAEDGNGGNQATTQSVTWNFNATTGTLTILGNGAMDDYLVGEAPWYQYRQQISSVVISDGVTSIGNYAFRGCRSLTEIEIPTGVTDIGDYAFSDCSSLTEIEIPTSVTSIGKSAFNGCNGLTNLTMPVGATYDCTYSEASFGGCIGITAVTLTGNGSMINYDDSSYLYTPWHISQANSITVTVEEGVTNIGNNAFSGCSGLTKVVIPDSVTDIGDNAFYYCPNLTDLTMPVGALYSNSAFSYCRGITAVTLTGNGPMINYDNDQFRYTPWHISQANSITVTVEEGVTSIGEYAFFYCYGLREIKLPSSITSIGRDAFNNCSNLTGIVIPNDVTNIGESAFWGCSGMTSITMPAGATYDCTYSNATFKGCRGLTAVTLTGDGEMINYDTMTYAYTPWYQSRTNSIAVIIEEGVTSIGDRAFSGCSGMISVDIPDSVINIGTCALQTCTSLTEVEFPSSLESIGQSAFFYCIALTNIEIPSGLTDIGDGAFEECRALESISVDTGNMVYDSRGNCNALIETETNELLLGCKNTVIPDSVTSIGRCAFNNCRDLTSIDITSGVTHIGAFAFEDCTGLTLVNIPLSVTNIGSYAFENCTGLTDVYYEGSSRDRDRIFIFNNNENLFSATWHYASCSHLNLEHHPWSDETYTRDGNIEYWVCHECGKYFGDEDCINEITQEQTVIPKKEVPSIEGRFSDVSKGDWFYAPVAFACATGIMKGMGGTDRFAPGEPLSRAQLAVMLHRLENSPYTEYAPIFPDVPDGEWYTQPVIWAYNNGIIKGYQSGYFGTADNITREQLALMLYRYAKDYKHLDVSVREDISRFNDAASVSSWAREAIEWAVGNGIITGKDNGTRIDPQGKAARCECAAMFQRFMERYGL